MRLLFTSFFAAAVLLGQEKMMFTKAFPASSPAYCMVQVTRAGDLTYQEAPKEENPVSAKLSSADTDALFDLAGKLDHFKGKLESGLKVANTGDKVFLYQDANGAKTQAEFNYSTDPNAQQLLDRFENIASSERAYINLDRTVHFDKLGVNDALAQVETLWLNKQLAAPQQFIPLLTRIATHESFMHLARERAARLKDSFAATPAPAA